MKHAIRISTLMLGLVGTYVAAAVPQVTAPDGGPIITCPPQQRQMQRTTTADVKQQLIGCYRWRQGHQSNLQ
jgi:hypothetical protein